MTKRIILAVIALLLIGGAAVWRHSRVPRSAPDDQPLGVC